MSWVAEGHCLSVSRLLNASLDCEEETYVGGELGDDLSGVGNGLVTPLGDSGGSANSEESSGELHFDSWLVVIRLDLVLYVEKKIGCCKRVTEASDCCCG